MQQNTIREYNNKYVVEQKLLDKRRMCALQWDISGYIMYIKVAHFHSNVDSKLVFYLCVADAISSTGRYFRNISWQETQYVRLLNICFMYSVPQKTLDV